MYPIRSVAKKRLTSRRYPPVLRMRRSVRYLRLRLRRSRPAEIARGLAVGTFVGMMPLFGVQTVFAIALATLVRGNPLVAATATWISNPVTFVPLYTLNFRIGQHLLGTQDLMLILQNDLSLNQFFKMGMDCVTTLSVGCFASGMPLALISYPLGLYLARSHREHYYRQ